MFMKLNVNPLALKKIEANTIGTIRRVNWIFHVDKSQFPTRKSFRAFIAANSKEDVLNIIGHQNFTTKDITLRDMFDQFDYVVVENRPRWADSLHKKDFIDSGE